MKNIIRSDICFDDAEGAACLLNEEIFEGLARIGSTMASAIICLADNQKFNFLKYIFDNMVKSLEGGKQKPKRKQRKEAEVSNDESEDEDHVPTPSSDPLPSGEDRFIRNELMIFCTSLQEQGRTNDNKMFGVDDLVGEEVVMEATTSVKDSASPTTDVIEYEVTMAQALAALKNTKPKVVVQEQEMSTIIPAAATIVTTVVPTLRAKGYNGLLYEEGRYNLVGEEVVMETTTGVKDSASPTTYVIEDVVTMAQALAALKNTKPKVVVQEQKMSTIIPADATIVTTAFPTLRAKGIVFHEQRQSQIPLALVVGTTIVTIVAAAGIVVLISCSCTTTLGFVLFNLAHA
nr:hypothetical protein [Tanacetum cinerariifolium]